jgi:hypothetical protein
MKAVNVPSERAVFGKPGLRVFMFEILAELKAWFLNVI